MARFGLVAAVLMALTVLAGFSTAHPMPYVGVGPPEVPSLVPPPIGVVDLGVSVIDCGGADRPPRLSFGGVCFGATEADGWGVPLPWWECTPGDPTNPDCLTPPQHLTAGSSATLDIEDAAFLFVSATYCQDFNNDGLCGGDFTGGPETEPGGNPSPICQGRLPPGLPPDAVAFSHPEGSFGCEFRSEPYVDFCDSITIFSNLAGPLPQGSRRIGGVAPGTAGSGDWADPTLDNWAIDFDVFVFFHTPARGNPVIGGPCGPSSASQATQGEVYHT